MKFNFTNTINFIATITVLIGLLLYTFCYLFIIKFFPYLDANQSLSLGSLLIKTVLHPTLYEEFATFATLAGLYAVLNDNRVKYMQKLKRDVGITHKNRRSKIKLFKASMNRKKNQKLLQAELKKKDQEIARLHHLMLIHEIPRK